MRTVGPSYPHYMRQYRYEGAARECQWNGPTWPFQTTQVLLGLANLLHDYHQRIVDRDDYLRLLRQYTAMHRQDGRLDLEEDYDPDTGRPVVGLARSHHYFHSGYVDLILSGLVGIRAREDDALTVAPLLAERSPLRWFRVQDVPYHGHLVSITWDADGKRFGVRGLSIEVDGKMAAHRDTPSAITIPLPRLPLPRIERPIDQAVQLVRGEYPRPSASTNADPEGLHDAIDGRIWFFPELANGWTAAASSTAHWYAVDFGEPRRLHRAELAFFADAGRIAAPTRYRLQAMTPTGWRDLAASAAPPLANGITHVAFAAVSTAKVRLVIDQREDRASRLVEMKLF